MLWRLARLIGLVLLALVMLLVGLWCTVAVWYQCTVEPWRSVLTGATALVALACVFALATRVRSIGFGAFAGCFALFLVWWATISPINNRDWAPDVARVVTAIVEGDQVEISNVRNFNWRSDTDFDQVWEQRTYRLSQVTDVDLLMSYWMGEPIAHTIVSFGFADGRRLAFSIETRKQRHQRYSSVAGFFKQYELAIVAADERDAVRVRSNVRHEDVRLYRLRVTPEDARRLLLVYLDEANDLAKRPRFYNTLTSNCTTLVFDIAKVIHPGLPMDVRVILAGYLPNYAYDVGATDTSISFEKLRELSHIDAKATQADTDPAFSARIREGVPRPH
jgi:Domain of unknown function (DUF4105)